jgi:hypothetical protein
MNNESLPHITMDPTVHLPSTWRSAIGKPLTDRSISKWKKLGFLGGVATPDVISKAVRAVKTAKERRSERRWKQLMMDNYC